MTEKQNDTPPRKVTAAQQVGEAAKVALEKALERGNTAGASALAAKAASRRSVGQTAELLKGTLPEKPAEEEATAPASLPAESLQEPPPPEIQRFYSAAARGFFSSDIHHPEKMPPDVVAITHDEWSALLDAQSQGKEIGVDQSGRPVAVDRVPTLEEKRRKIQAQMDAIDAKSVRAFREERLQSLGLLPAPEKGQQTPGERLHGHEQQMAALRAQMQALQS